MAAHQSNRRSPKIKDLMGLVFGRLTVIRLSDSCVYHGKAAWVCRCECGAEPIVISSRLTNGTTKSCGCWRRECASQQMSSRLVTHGMTHAPEYKVWIGMMTRCYNRDDPGYPNYGGRGVVVCPKWRGSFEDFFADLGPRPTPRHTIDRIDVNGNYEPGNCRWATRKEQGRNRRTNRIIEYNGQSKLLIEWSELTGLSEVVIAYRIRHGWSVEDALTVPAGHRKGKLTWDDIREIRRLRAMGWSSRKLQKFFGVGEGTITDITFNRRWIDLDWIPPFSPRSRKGIRHETGF